MVMKCRTQLLWLLLISLVALSGCKSGSNTEGAVIVKLQNGGVDRLEIKVRNEAYKAYAFNEVLTDKNLLTESYRVAIQPTDDLNERFFIYVQGHNGAALAAASSFATREPEQSFFD